MLSAPGHEPSPTNSANGKLPPISRRPQPPAVLPFHSPDNTTPPLTSHRAFNSFLDEPHADADFHRNRALHHRTQRAKDDRDKLHDRLRQAVIDTDSIARIDDPTERRHLSFPLGTAISVGLALVDVVPAFLAAQAFGAGSLTTFGITLILVAALASAMWAVAHFQHGWQRWAVISALAGGLLSLGLLRWWFLIVTSSLDGFGTSLWTAAAEAIGLTLFTALLVWLGVVILGFTKSRRVSREEARVRSLNRQLDAADKHLAWAQQQQAEAWREFEGRARLFASRQLPRENDRLAFLSRLHSEVEQNGTVSRDD